MLPFATCNCKVAETYGKILCGTIFDTRDIIPLSVIMHTSKNKYHVAQSSVQFQIWSIPSDVNLWYSFSWKLFEWLQVVRRDLKWPVVLQAYACEDETIQLPCLCCVNLHAFAFTILCLGHYEPSWGAHFARRSLILAYVHECHIPNLLCFL
jgi:hypothetical protein